MWKTKVILKVILMVILMGVITICRSNLTAAAETIARIPEMKLLRASPSWVLASVSYVGISVVWLASYLTSIGRRAKSIASASVGAAGGVIAFYIGMLLIYFAIMLNIDELAGAQIPMLILAGRISPVTSGVFSILIVTGIYTASVPLLWQTAFRLAEEGSLRFKRIAVILAAAGIAASLLLPVGLKYTQYILRWVWLTWPRQVPASGCGQADRNRRCSFRRNVCRQAAV